ncbi:MAG: hypothetical protein AAF560_00280 [Acidobacteriota bacterium]
MVTQRIRQRDALVSSIQVFSDDVATALEARFIPALRTGETIPDHRQTLRLAARSIDQACDELVELDEQHASAISEQDHLGAEVEWTSKKELYPQASGVRRAINAAVGFETGFKLHSFSGPTPRATAPLRQQVSETIRRLGDVDSRLLIARPGEIVDVDHWLERLSEPFRRLASLDHQLVEATERLASLSHERETAMSHFDRLYANTLQLVTALFRFAGLSDRVIRKLRPYVQRRRLSREARQKRRARATDASTISDAKVLDASDAPASSDAKTLDASVASAISDAKIFDASVVSASSDAKIVNASVASASSDAEAPDTTPKDAAPAAD